MNISVGDADPRTLLLTGGVSPRSSGSEVPGTAVRRTGLGAGVRRDLPGIRGAVTTLRAAEEAVAPAAPIEDSPAARADWRVEVLGTTWLRTPGTA